jgi:hypothetical protein
VLRHLVPVRFGQRKSVAEQFELRLRSFRHNHFHDIEPKQNIRIVQQPQPGQTAASDSILFFPMHRLERPAELLPRPCFHFHEDEGVAIAADNVDLAAGAPFEITIQNFVAVLPQEPAGQVLPACPKPEMPGLRSRKPAAPPVRKIVDESDKARVHAVL